MATRDKRRSGGVSRIWDAIYLGASGRSPAVIHFRWTSSLEDLTWVRVKVETPVGPIQRIVSAKALGISGSEGTGTLQIQLSRMPAGATSLTLTPLSAERRAGGSGVTDFVVPGVREVHEGAVVLRPISDRIVRPGSDEAVFFRGRVGMKDGATALFIRVEGPNGSEDTIDLAPPMDGEPVVLFAFGPTHSYGTYRVTAHAIDREGSVWSSKAVAVSLVKRADGVLGPHIRKVRARRRPQVLVLLGSRLFDSSTSVTFNGLATAILKASDSSLTVEVPVIEGQAVLTIRTAAGIATRSIENVSTTAVRIVPSKLELEQGTERRLSAIVTGTLDARVEWKLQGGRGMSLTDSGRLRASGQAEGKFTVVARTLSDPSAVDSMRGRIVPRRAGGAAMVGSLGGELSSTDGKAVLHIPGGALKGETRIKLDSVRPRKWTEGDKVVVSADVAVLGPRRKMKRPAALDVSVRSTGDRSMPLVLEVVEGRVPKRTGSKQLIDLAEDRVRILINEIPLRILVGVPVLVSPLPVAEAHPIIRSISPEALNEGETAAILLTGANFVPGLTTVDVLDEAGQVEPRIYIRSNAITVDGKKLGIALKVGVMTDFGEGTTRTLAVRAKTPVGSATYPINIICHDELFVPARTSVSVFTSKTFSAIDVPVSSGLGIDNAFPPIALTCYESATLASTIETAGGVATFRGMGIAGNPGDVPHAGRGGLGGFSATGSTAGGGGSGGDGATGSGAVGSDGKAGKNSVTLTFAGVGGTGGLPGGGGFFPHLGGNGGNGGAGTRSFRTNLLTLAFEPGPGGGGGGVAAARAGCSRRPVAAAAVAAPGVGPF